MKTQGSVLGRRITKFLILFALFSFSSEGFAHPMLQYWENHTGSHAGLILEPRAGYFSTSSNFDDNSNSVALPASASNTRMLVDLNANYGVNNDFFIFSRFSLLSAKVQVPNQRDSSNFGLGDCLGGFAYRAFNSDGSFSLNLQGEVRVSAYSNSAAKSSGNAYLGDGSTDMTAGIFTETPLRLLSITDFYLEGGLGYTYRSKGFSSAIPWSLILKRDPAYRGFLFEGGVMGQVSLKTDIATHDSTTLLNTVSDRLTGSGGSMLINGVNPAWLGAHGKIGYKTQAGHTIYAGIDSPLMGTDIPSGIMVSLGVTFDFAPLGGEDPEPSPKTPVKLNKRTPPPSSIKGFSSYDLEAAVRSYNDQLFLVKIDKGSTDSVEKGQLFDIFMENQPIARAKVTHVNSEEAALIVVEYYQDHWIETGSIARRLLR